MKLIDLHVHSTISDGTLSPEELAVYAKQKGLNSMALTDHDTIAGIEACTAKGIELGIEIIPGIEFSANHHGKEVHILGYYINPKDAILTNRLERLVTARSTRNEQMLQKLTELGLPLTMKDLIATLDAPYTKETIFTRAHIAKAMVQKGYINERSEAFSRYIGDGKPGFIPKARFTSEECIDLIHQAGGLAVLAHPMLYGYGQSDIAQVISIFKQMGLDGVECLYSTHSQDETHHLLTVCHNLDLFPTGGSDFHGKSKPNLDLGCGYGKLAIPYTLLETIKKIHQNKA